ncbi:hypothetical protein ACH5RR_037651 [Cinchona calisaya]|uniref:Phytocyanin domain-containing protein n=1 Tax=Cinchona calisaya TaxID=153742 RepID=A0ABD2Y6T7_9GENT
MHPLNAMADHKRYSSAFLLFLASFIFSSYAYQFDIGGRDGWVSNPSENYNHWAERLRFQVNDTLFFKYKKGSDSVLEVNKDDYNKCNIDKPITKLEDGNSIFKFDKSGPFYFISGNKANCDKGQKIVIVVLAVRTPPKPPAISPSIVLTPSPSPTTSLPPSSSNNAPAGSPGLSPAPAPADINSPPGGSSARPAFNTPSIVTMSAVSLIVLCLTLGAAITSL